MTLRPPSTSIDHDNAVIGVGGFSASVRQVAAKTHVSELKAWLAESMPEHTSELAAGSNPAARISTLTLEVHHVTLKGYAYVQPQHKETRYETHLANNTLAARHLIMAFSITSSPLMSAKCHGRSGGMRGLFLTTNTLERK